MLVAEGVRYDPRNGGAHFAVSASGALVYGPGPLTSPDHRLAWLDGAGVFHAVMETPRAFRERRLSPDARRVALVIGQGAEADLWVLDLPSGTLSRLTFGLRPRRPLWTRDGRRIVFALAEGRGSKVVSVGLEGGAPVTLLESAHRVYPNTFTPDGRRLVYQERHAGTGWDLRIADGRFVAYESDELDNVFEVYVRPLEGGVKVRATNTGARSPRFGAGGRLYYWYTFEGQLHELDYRAETRRVVVGPGRPVFDRARVPPRRLVVGSSFGSYDLDAARQRLLVLDGGALEAPPLVRPVVVLNWADERVGAAPSREGAAAR
jgi:dipeptidyl aminopeptidase/acylaminoacyl peptidase